MCYDSEFNKKEEEKKKWKWKWFMDGLDTNSYSHSSERFIAITT